MAKSLSLKDLIDLDKSNFNVDRPDNIRHNQILTAYSKTSRPKTFVFKYLTDLLVAGSNVTLVQNSDGTLTINSSGGGGTIGLSLPPAFTVVGSPVVGSGTFTVTGAGTSAQYIDGTGNLQTFPTGGTGTVTSVNLAVPSIFSLAGNPISTSGTITIGLNTQAANLVFAGPSSGSAAIPTFRALTLADLTVVTDPGVISVSTANAREDNYTPTGWPGTTTITKVIRITPTNANNIVSIGGLTNGVAGQMVTIVNAATDQLLIIDHDSPTSTAANRFRLQHQTSYFLLPGRDITFLYNGTRWSQMSYGNWGGLDVVDHFTSGPQNRVSPAVVFSTTYMSWISSGAASGIQSSGNLGNFDLGGVQLSTGSTVTGNTVGGMAIRHGSGNNALNLNGQFPMVMLAIVDATPTPTALQDVVCGVGLESNSGSWVGNGYIWKTPAFATFANVWEIDVINTGGGLAVNVVTAVATTTKQYLGIWNHGNNGNVTFFSSTNGITYSAVYRFTRVSNNFAGYPKIRISSLVGTTPKNWTAHMLGVSLNQKR